MSPTTSSDRRRFQRISFDAEVTIQQSNRSWISQLLDISFRGALVHEPADWGDADANAPFELRVNLGAEHLISFNGHLRHAEKGHLGFSCEHMDLDSASTLRRLVELNLGSSDLLERELAALIETV
ncbi:MULTISPECIES: PilZ domain-containing protein [unclassified Hahella]|uniref:PilZ domain-containing protein n=1 Tax=unclassified Hahella TaxID=2624107 RepID=UPI000FDDC332|nr:MULTISPECIES: PilZ domain-containing protein [unclassified Hahella]AZZ94390.1 PilZ domain-containing protein [Hahella sp. KA22]MBU6953949.1 PilZ domain-containing protein [Hahella sp. HN01]MDG9670361.1 PilZ domain-containing protein [Hahella sp. CR1]QAY57764.1 PilZ domain-containing protein [Hahella sp. KA22]